jgi:hypothetical protein
VSVQVSIPELFAQIEEWGPGYLLTGSDEGRPHLIALRPTVDGAALRFDAGGGRACRNAIDRPEVTVLFPPHAGSNGFSLVVDGEATVDGDLVVVRPTRALLHRPAP